MRHSVNGFVGSRLREARLARGLTGTALADLVGVNSSAISHYENNRHAPTFDVLEKLADKLNVSQMFFTRAPRLEHERVVFWRSRQAATIQQRDRAIQRYYWLLDVADYLARFVEFPEVDFPELDIPADPLSLTLTQIDDIAASLREAWSIGTGPIGNLVGLLERHGAIVVRAPVETENLDAFSEWRSDDSRPYIMLGSDKGSDARSRMDAAHELGHMILHRSIPLRDFNKTAVHSVMEQQVKRFAGAFLLPAASFSDDVFSISLDAFRDIKPRWRVAISAMVYRSSEIGLIDDDQAKKLWIGMSRRKWKKNEPGDAETPPEEPFVIRQAFNMLLDNGMIDPRIMEVELGLRLRDIEAVAGLPSGYLHNSDTGPLKFKIE